jgi:hypothetical protein
LDLAAASEVLAGRCVAGSLRESLVGRAPVKGLVLRLRREAAGKRRLRRVHLPLRLCLLGRASRRGQAGGFTGRRRGDWRGRGRKGRLEEIEERTRRRLGQRKIPVHRPPTLRDPKRTCGKLFAVDILLFFISRLFRLLAYLYLAHWGRGGLTLRSG